MNVQKLNLCVCFIDTKKPKAERNPMKVPNTSNTHLDPILKLNATALRVTKIKFSAFVCSVPFLLLGHLTDYKRVATPDVTPGHALL